MPFVSFFSRWQRLVVKFKRDINIADRLRFGVEHTSEQPKLQNAAKQIVALAAKNNVQTTSCKRSEARTKFALSCDPSIADKLPTAIDFSPSAKACPACQRACDSSARRLLTVAWIDRCRRVSSPLQTVRSTSDADDNPARRLRRPLQHLRVLRCRFRFRNSFNNGSIADVAPLAFVPLPDSRTVKEAPAGSASSHEPRRIGNSPLWPKADCSATVSVLKSTVDCAVDYADIGGRCWRCTAVSVGPD
jgi:hypothetical protein